MTPRTAAIAYFATLPVFFVIDMIWLGWLSGDFYQRHIGHLLGPVNWQAAQSFYLVFIAGIVLFSVRPGLAANSPKIAGLWGALFGFFTYATYDLTNYATLRDWPAIVVIVDIAWGTVLCGSVGFISCLITQKVLKLK